uniref:Uncharacterized protein n=1 Tax=Amphiprion percula TaxID=161767 RepID=A0A3P8RJP1_AMPPE
AAEKVLLIGILEFIEIYIPFDLLRHQMSDVLGDGGILKEVVQPGEGPPVPQNASVLIHYSGFLEYSDQPFETTTNFRYPVMMKLGRGTRFFTQVEQ